MSILRHYRDSFSGLPRAVRLLSLVAFVNSSGRMVLPFFSLYVTQKLHFRVAEAGLLLSLHGVGAIFGTYVGGWLSSQVGPTATQATSLLLSGAGFLLLLLLKTPVSLAVGLLVFGVVTEAFRPANATAIADCVEPSLRARAMALNRLAINLGAAVGPALGGFLTALDYSLLFYIDAMTSVSAGLLVLLLRRPASSPEQRTEPSGDADKGISPWRDTTFLLGLLLLLPLLVVFYQFDATYPLYLRDAYGLVESEIGILFAINTIVIVLFEMVLVAKMERRNHLRVIGVGALVACLGFGLLPFGESFVFATFLVVVWTTGEMLVLPFTMAFAATRTERRSRGRYIGWFVMSFSIAATIAPAIGTWVYERTPDGVWYGSLVFGGVTCIGYFVLASRVSVTEHVPRE